MPYKKKYSEKEKAEYKKQKQAEIEDMIKRIDEGVQAVFESEHYKEYLRFSAKFTDYSPHNTMLINLQKPTATLVASYGKWKRLGRQVNIGERGIAIFAPVIFKEDKSLNICKNASENSEDEDKENAAEKPKCSIAFKKVYVYDISQTSGKDIPRFGDSELTGDIDSAKKKAIIKALENVTGIKLEFSSIKGGAKGYYNFAEDRIVIKSGMSDAQTLKTAFHETAHKLLHDPKGKISTVNSPRNEKEVQAESVAFMVADRLGLDTSEYSFPYIASWSNGRQLVQLKGALWEIQGAAKRILGEIERVMFGEKLVG